MKTRNGFVSNSSSSSFVVAFPKQPTSFDDVFEMMFNGKEGEISVYDMDGMSHKQIAMRVWEDIKMKMDKKNNRDPWDTSCAPARLKNVAYVFANRYHYTVRDNIWWSGRKNDELGGSWSYPIDRYFGSDKKLLDEYRDLIIKTEKREEEIRNRQREIVDKDFAKPSPKYAYKGGIDCHTKKPYTKEEISARKKWEKAFDKFKATHEEYAALEKEDRELRDNRWSNYEKFSDKLSKKDAKVFIEDHKDSFIVILEYADEGGEATLEHGDIFRNLDHVKVSNH